MPTTPAPPSIPFSAVLTPNRARNDKKYGNLESLKDSLTRLGTIHPLVLSRNADNTFSLIAGGRRHRALSQLGCTELFHASTLQPGRPGFLFEDEVPAHTRKEAELDENLQRLDMDWIDSIMLVADTHAAKKGIDNTWGLRQTAALLGDGYGKTQVGHAVNIAKRLRAGDKELLACDNMSAAISLLVKRQEDAALAVLQQRVAGSRSSSPSTHSFLDTINIDLGPKKSFEGGETSDNRTTDGTVANNLATNSVASATVPGAAPVPSAAAPVVDIPLSRMFVLGDSILSVMPGLPSTCFNHILTDIPYGIDMENLVVANKESVEAQHEVEANVEQMPEFLRQSFRLLRDGGFCVFFYDLDHHEKLQAYATAAGFTVQRWPFIATKTSACANQAAAYNLTKNYEVAMFLRKDPSAVLRHNPKFALNNSSWKSYDFASERKQYANPFAKPFELWKDILDMIAFPGQSIFDPFAGEGSSLRAVANCGMTPFGCEISSVHYNRGVENMKAVYARIHTSNVTFS